MADLTDLPTSSQSAPSGHDDHVDELEGGDSSPRSRPKALGRWESLRDSAATLVYVAILFLISLLPYRLAVRAAGEVGRMRYHLARRRNRARIQLIAMQLSMRVGADPAQALSWVRRSFRLAAIEDLEVWLYQRCGFAQLRQMIRYEGLENLREQIERKRGAILYTGHARSCETAGLALVALGLPSIHTRSRPGRKGNRHWRWFTAHVDDAWRKYGVQIVWQQYPRNPLNTAIRLVNALRRNECYLLASDQRFTPAGAVEVEMLNQWVWLSEVPTKLAQKTGVPLIHFWPHRDERTGLLTVTIGQPYYVEGDAQRAVEHQAARLEEEIVRDPASWFKGLYHGL